MTKRLIVEVLLVPESLEIGSDKIEKEILREFNEGFIRIPWSCGIEKIRIIDL